MRSDLSHKGRGNARSRGRRFNFQTANFETVIASEARQSIAPREERMDCFVACAPRNDVKSRYDSAISRREAPEFSKNRSPSKQRAHGMPGAQCTRSLACSVVKHTRVGTTGTP